MWPDVLDPDAVREVARDEGAHRGAAPHARGSPTASSSAGYGGIRDIEFAVQLLQLVHGRARPHGPRAERRSTRCEQLAARRLRDGRPTPRTLDDAYIWLRTVEHRLATRRRAADAHDPGRHRGAHPRSGARARLPRHARRRPRSKRSTREHRAQQAAVRSIHEKLFFAPLLDTLAGVGALSPEAAAEERLAAFGFRDIEQTRAALRELTPGSRAGRGVMQQLLPAMLGWLSTTPDPDLGLLAAAPADRGLHELVDARPHVPRLAGRGRAHVPHPRIVAGARRSRCTASPTSSTRSPTTTSLAAERDARRARRRRARHARLARGRPEPRRDGLRRFKRRELLRIGARDLLGFADLEAVGQRAVAPRRRVRRSRAAVARTRRAVRGDRPGPARRRASSRTPPTST